MMDRLTPIGAIAERGSIELMLRHGLYTLPPAFMRATDGSSEHYKQLLPVLAEQMRRAEILVWDNSIMRTAQAGYEAFVGRSAPGHVFSIPPQLWLPALDQPYSADQVKTVGLNGNWLYIGLLLFSAQCMTFKPGTTPDRLREAAKPLGEGICDELLKVLDHQGQRFMAGAVFIGRDLEGAWDTPTVIPFPAYYQDEPMRIDLAAQVAALLFAQSEIACEREFKPPRQYLRHEARKGRPVPVVKTVVLRRWAENSQRVRDQNMRQAVEWSCQWLVRGHWRHLNQPRKSDGWEFTYVSPYVKGPEDKPLRPAAETVALVAR